MVKSLASNTTAIVRRRRTHKRRIVYSPGNSIGAELSPAKRYSPESHNSISGGSFSASASGTTAIASPVATIDPLVRALNTFMFGMVIHFGTLWMFFGISSPRQNHESYDSTTTVGWDNNGSATESLHQDSSSSSYSWIAAVLLLHEYWVYLQHCNVLANPYCQRLDRQYGIALLKSNQHWAIAGTLSAYWCRESLSMFLSLPFLAPKRNNSNSTITATTQYWIIYSLIYHTMKTRGVRQDALRRFSPSPFGIMRVVMDKFYLHSKTEVVSTMVRLLLQGIDTYIHQVIVQDLLQQQFQDDTIRYNSILWLHLLFGVWIVHATLNQYFRCSTATAMVHAWYAMTTRQRQQLSTTVYKSCSTKLELLSPPTSTTTPSSRIGPGDDASIDNGDAASVSSAESSSDDDGLVTPSVDEDFIVRKLLQKGRLGEDDSLKGRQGPATDGVDTVVRIETACAILAIVFLIGLDRVPLLALTIESSSSATWWNECTLQLATAASVTWFLGSLLHGIWYMFLKDTSPRSIVRCSTFPKRATQRAIINTFDLTMLIVTAMHIHPSKTSAIAWPLAVGVTFKSYLQATGVARPKIFGLCIKVLEFSCKLLLLRTILANYPANNDKLVTVETYIAFVWAVWVILSPIPTPCETASPRVIPGSPEDSVADVVFLGHPAELIDCWALWLLPYSVDERWKGPFWAIPLWPLHYLVGWYVCNYRQWLFGNKASFFCCDDVVLGGTRMQTWTAAHFARHFLTHPTQVKRNIEAAARHAEKTGVRVLCLGALNKAESINGGGIGVVRALGKNRLLSVIHGNHLTAAAVVETVVQSFGTKAKVFLTGASSKVGWAVAQALRDRHGYLVLCHSSDAKRRKFFEQQGFVSASKLSEGTQFSPFWIVGKYDLMIPILIPQNAIAVVFSVPHSLSTRSDVRVIEAGILHLDSSKLDRPRQFTNKLKGHEIFACHAAAVVANHRLQRDQLRRLDETGPVDPCTMDSWLMDAKKLGFHVPYHSPVSDFCCPKPILDRLPIVIVGAGPAGLATAASLVRQQVPVVLLERQTDPSQFGSWTHHFTGLEVTSQKKWCNLPWFDMPSDEFPGETISATDYCCYLQLYAARFGLDIRRGITVHAIEKGEDAFRPWTVSYTTENGKKDDLVASAVIVATGKHRVPNRDTNDFLFEKLCQADIPALHSTDLRDNASWNQAIQAAQVGRLAIVGFGNSACDLATIILPKCHNSVTAKIHISARTIPPVFPRRASFLRVDSIGHYLSRWLPCQILEDVVVTLLWSLIPSSRRCNRAFPPHLPRWSRICGRVPVIDKYGVVGSGFQSGRLQGHGTVVQVDPNTKSLIFDDRGANIHHGAVTVDMVILATGYSTKDALVTKADPLNGLYMCGFGNDRFLPLQSIGEEAKEIAREIVADLGYKFNTGIINCA